MLVNAVRFTVPYSSKSLLLVLTLGLTLVQILTLSVALTLSLALNKSGDMT